jgi:hypothetical protein
MKTLTEFHWRLLPIFLLDLLGDFIFISVTSLNWLT